MIVYGHERPERKTKMSENISPSQEFENTAERSAVVEVAAGVAARDVVVAEGQARQIEVKEVAEREPTVDLATKMQQRYTKEVAGVDMTDEQYEAGKINTAISIADALKDGLYDKVTIISMGDWNETEKDRLGPNNAFAHEVYDFLVDDLQEEAETKVEVVDGNKDRPYADREPGEKELVVSFAELVWDDDDPAMPPDEQIKPVASNMKRWKELTKDMVVMTVGANDRAIEKGFQVTDDKNVPIITEVKLVPGEDTP